MKFKILLLLAIVAGFWCCDDKDGQQESVNLSIKREIGTDTVSWQEGSFDIKVSSNGDWAVEVLSDGDWVEVSPEFGTGDQEVKVIYSGNPDEKVRTAYISFSTVDTRRSMSFSQFGSIPVVDPSLDE